MKIAFLYNEKKEKENLRWKNFDAWIKINYWDFCLIAGCLEISLRETERNKDKKNK